MSSDRLAPHNKFFQSLYYVPEAVATMTTNGTTIVSEPVAFGRLIMLQNIGDNDVIVSIGDEGTPDPTTEGFLIKSKDKHFVITKSEGNQQYVNIVDYAGITVLRVFYMV